ncbi:MAG: peptidoglycan/LPS O-acetylase OafA/YrhL [Acidimicrobiales bacterium]|jgi:peptidoglycan/LPS O-acetylase OafA/YrhL
MDADNIRYRPYIDGLRALAVVAVIIFHLNPGFFPGGYLGVDVFFVISGFVISQSLYKNYLKTGKVNITQFYIRRFWRLYPALITMISATTAAYVFFGFVWDTNLFIKSAITSILAVSNLYYLKQAENYFHQDLINPLLHTWSLGIEEQFYILYPLLLLVVLFIFARLSIRRTYIALLFLIGSILLYMSFYFNQDSVLGDFYFPTARFWELGVGCALFFFSLDFGIKRFAGALSGGALLMLLTVLVFQKNISSLPLELLMTVSATSLLIFSGLRHRSAVIGLFEYVPIVYIGNISYSLYLWHLPVIYFCNLYLSGVWYYLFSILLTIVLAVLSYIYVENRFRHHMQDSFSLKRVLYVSLGVMTVLVIYVISVGPSEFTKQVNAQLNALAVHVDSVNYIESQFNLADRIQPQYLLNGVNVSEYCSEGSTDYTSTDDGLRSECLKSIGSTSVIYLTGDSHAAHYIPMLDATELEYDIYFSRFPRQAIINAQGLPVKTGESIQARKIELQALSERYDTVYYMTSLFLSNGADYPEIMEKTLEKYIQELSPYVTLIFVAPTPVFTTSPESCVLLGVHCTLNKAYDQERRSVVLTVQEALATKYELVDIYDPYEFICPGEECFIYNKENDFLLYMDDDHLSVEASVSLSSDFDAWFTQKYLEWK